MAIGGLVGGGERNGSIRVALGANALPGSPMKIIVPVKVAGSLDESARLDGGQIDRSSLDWEINEWDRFAVEAALELRADHGGEVVVISAGGDETEDGLLTALAMGADRRIQVQIDDEATTLDAIGIARVLAIAIRPEAPDLILAGTQSSDGASAATGTALAALLGLPRVAVVRSIAVDDNLLRVQRELEGGLLETLELPLPAVLTVQTGINEPRYATLRGIRQASAKPSAELRLDQLGLVSEELTARAGRVSHSSPPVSSTVQILDGDARAVAAQIASIIKSRVGT